MNNIIDPSQLQNAVAEALKEYNEDVTKALKTEVKNVAKKAAKELKAESPKRTGEYSKNWAAKVMYQSSLDIRMAVHNKKRYMLTHLLEKGHAKKNGGRVDAIPHIGNAEQSAIKALGKKIKVIVKG